MNTSVTARSLWNVLARHFQGTVDQASRRGGCTQITLALNCRPAVWNAFETSMGRLRRTTRSPYVLAFPHWSMLVPHFGQVRPPQKNFIRFTDLRRCSCSRPHLGQVTFRSNPLPCAMSQTEFRLRPHFPDRAADSAAIISKRPLNTAATTATKRNTMLPILEALRPAVRGLILTPESPLQVTADDELTQRRTATADPGSPGNAAATLRGLSCWPTPFS